MSELQSEQIVVSSPMSFSGSARRLANMLWTSTAIKALVGWWLLPLAVTAAWALIACWYLAFGIFVVPWRLIRRGSRKRKRDDARHREVLDAQSSQSP